MSSQSTAVAPVNVYVPRTAPVPSSANTRAVSPESLCTHQVPGLRTPTWMPEISRRAGSVIGPAVDVTRVFWQVATTIGAARARQDRHVRRRRSPAQTSSPRPSGRIYPCSARRAVPYPATEGAPARRSMSRSRDEATDRTRQQLPADGDAHHLRPRRVARHLRSRDRAARARVRGRPRADRVAAASRAAVPAPARRGPARHRPSVLDRGSRLRPRLPPAPHRGAATGGPLPARRARRPHRGASPRPHPPAVGDVRHRGSRGRLRRRAHRRSTTRASTASPARRSSACCSTSSRNRHRRRRPARRGSGSGNRARARCWRAAWSARRPARAWVCASRATRSRPSGR